MKDELLIAKADLASKIAANATLEGEFTLRSGQVSNRYFDKYRFEGTPSLLRALARAMADLLPTETEIIAGLELGGVPLVTAISLEIGLPAAFVRKEAKTYGTCRAIEGQDVANRNVTFVEDVITDRRGGCGCPYSGRKRESQCACCGLCHLAGRRRTCNS
jgi:orotate phosphoribosyltransferase